MLLPVQFAAERDRMVRSQLADRGICDLRVLDAFRDVPREEFVPSAYRDQAYDDHPLPIGSNQTISQPYIVAVMLQHLDLQAEHRALEVGAGSGYATALLARICKEVYAIERHPELAAAAQATLQRLGFANTHVRTGDGTSGWPEEAPFDVILVSAASSQMPFALFAQLREGGRMIVPVGTLSCQDLHLITRQDGLPLTKVLEGCRFVPLVEGPVESG